MEKYIPAPIDEKNIVSDFINEFMNASDEYQNGHYHAIIGTPLESNKPYLCEWDDCENWLRIRPIETVVNHCDCYTRYTDNKRIANEFCKEHDDDLLVIKEVKNQMVKVKFYFVINN